MIQLKFNSILTSAVGYRNFNKSTVLKPIMADCVKLSGKISGDLHLNSVEIKKLLKETAMKLNKTNDVIKKTQIVDESIAQLGDSLRCKGAIDDTLSRSQRKFDSTRRHEIMENMVSKMCLKNLLIQIGEEKMAPRQYNIFFAKNSKKILTTINRYESFLSNGLEKNKAQPSLIFNNSMEFPMIEALENKVKLENRNADILQKYASGIYYPTYSGKERVNDFDLYTLFSNLTQNACKYSKKGAKVITNFEETIIDGKKHLTFSVKDMGIGIPKDELEKVLEGERATNAIGSGKQGSGFGLQCTSRILKNLSSKLEIKSPLYPKNKMFPGTEIKFSIPIAD